METITLGDKRIGIKTSVLEEKATACNMLCCYADELKEGFYPWIDQVRVQCFSLGFYLLKLFSANGALTGLFVKQVAPTLVPLLKFYFHEEVRKAAVSGEMNYCQRLLFHGYSKFCILFILPFSCVALLIKSFMLFEI